MKQEEGRDATIIITHREAAGDKRDSFTDKHTALDLSSC